MDYTKLFETVKQVESNGNPLAVSPKGAVGTMQTMPTTLTKPGFGVVPAKDNSPLELERVGQDYLKAMIGRYGDLPTALTAYNWGPGNADQWLKDGADVTKLPKETQDYRTKIMSRMAGSAKDIRKDALQQQATSRMGVPTNPATRDAALSAENVATKDYVTGRPSLTEMFGAALGGTFEGVISKAVFAPQFEEEAGFKPDMTLLPQDADTHLVNEYAGSKSTLEAQQSLNDWNEEKLRQKTMADRGVGPAVALQFGAEFASPVNWVVPFAATKALGALGRGSEALMKAGQTSAGYASAIGENLVSGTALEAIKQRVDGEFKPADLAISLVADGLMGAGSAFLSARHAATSLAHSASEKAIAREFALSQRAEQQVGKSADSALLRSTMDKLHEQDVNTVIKDALGDVPPEQQVIKERWIRPKWEERQSTDNLDSYSNLPDNSVDTTDTRKSLRLAPETPEFKSWFGSSKVTNEDGTPRLVYHGTVSNFDEFSKAFLGSNTGASSAREGFFFAGHPTTADAYSQMREGANTMPVYLSIQNPLVVDLAMSARRKTSYASLVKKAKEDGHDGLIIKNTVDGALPDDIHVVFDSRQIKSAIGNSGAYSKTDPRINYALTPEDATKFASKGNEARVGREMTGDNQFTEMATYGIFKHTEDFAERKAQLDNLVATPGVHLVDGIANSKEFTRYARVIETLRKQLIPDVAIHLTDGGTGIGNASGAQGIIKPGVSMVAIKPGSGLRVVAHEFAHAVFAHEFSKLPAEKQQAMVNAWETWKKTFDVSGSAQESMLKRSPVGAAHDTSGSGGLTAYVPAVHGRAVDSLREEIAKAFPTKAEADKFNDYFSNFNEYSAEQMVKHFEAVAAKETESALSLPKELLRTLMSLVESALKVFKLAKEKGYLGAEEPFKNFVEDLIAGNAAKGLDSAGPTEIAKMAVPAKPAGVVNELSQDPDFIRFGLANVPMSTPNERKEAQVMLALHKQAEQWAITNPKDAAWDARAQNLADNNVFNVSSIGLTMLKSESPLLRMVASQLVEDASGVVGKRNATAAISKGITERMIMGNVINDFEGAYAAWSKGRPGVNLDNWNGGTFRAEFNKLVAQEIEARGKTAGYKGLDENVNAVADSLEAGYQRSANEQRRVGTLGAEGLAPTSRGYMPHRMSPERVMALTNEERQVLHQALTDQFITIEGWDMSFSDKLASAYIKRMRDKAAGDYGTAMGGSASANDVEEALRSMDLPKDTIADYMDKFTKGAAGFTKKRINLDLNKDYNGFKLIDLFDTDQIALFRSQAGKASGEIALTKFGIKGKPGLNLIREAIRYGEDGKQAVTKEVEAFDQMAAEFYNEPFGTAAGKWMSRVVQANSVVRLGGIVFNQLAEAINGIFHVGAAKSLQSVGAMGRLRSEIIALSKGEKVDNPWLKSIEEYSGAEFGTDAYKLVMPFDNANLAYPAYGKDSLTMMDRLLRGAGHLQSKLSGWRAIHSAQNRGYAEQIVKKMLEYVHDGKSDSALDDFGITASVRQHLRDNLNDIASFDSAGRPLGFDVTKIPDPDIREQVIQSIWRGTHQIIQGTFIGEKGKWAHDGWSQMVTQFRSFGITSMEKQWGRQRNLHGTPAALGMLLGSMSIAAPIYMLRTYASSIGRPDQQAYLEERLNPQAIARATMNYVAKAGMAGDFLDLATAALPESLGVTPTGGRAGVESNFIGTYVLPSSSLVDDIWKYVQSPTNINDALKILPGSRIPFLVPALNNLKE